MGRDSPPFAVCPFAAAQSPLNSCGGAAATATATNGRRFPASLSIVVVVLRLRTLFCSLLSPHSGLGVERFQIFRFRFGSVPKFSVPVRFDSKIFGAGSVRFQYCKTKNIKNLLLHDKKNLSRKKLYTIFKAFFSVFFSLFHHFFKNFFLLIYVFWNRGSLGS